MIVCADIGATLRRVGWRDIRLDWTGVMPEEVDELDVKRHIRMKSKLGSIDVHCSDSAVGAWLVKGQQCVGMAVEPSGIIGVSFYDDRRKAMPIMALSTAGLQLRDESGQPRVIPWADVLAKLS